MIFPKCRIGRMPQIAYTGHVLPCCWMPYDDNILFDDMVMKQTPFMKEHFNIYNNKLADIINSDEWIAMLDNINIDTPIKCRESCSDFVVDNEKFSTQNSKVVKFNPNEHNLNSYIDKTSTDEKLYKQAINNFKGYTGIQIETTTRCSLKCPYCARTNKVSLEKHQYKKEDLSLEVLYDVFSTEGIERITDCGRYGDSSYHPRYHDILDLLIESKTVKNYQLSIAATGHKEKWWQIAIDKFVTMKQSGTNPELVFGIDGLRETSKIHRINQNFDEIWNAMITCNQLGIDVIWQVIPTSANEHQLDEIENIANELNIPIRLVISDRWKDRPNAKDVLAPKNHNLRNFKFPEKDCF